MFLYCICLFLYCILSIKTYKNYPFDAFLSRRRKAWCRPRALLSGLPSAGICSRVLEKGSKLHQKVAPFQKIRVLFSEIVLFFLLFHAYIAEFSPAFCVLRHLAPPLWLSPKPKSGPNGPKKGRNETPSECTKATCPRRARLRREGRAEALEPIFPRPSCVN